MAKLAWRLLPIALAAGVAAGYFVRGEKTKTQIQTVVQIRTVAAPPPATHALMVEVRGPNGTCLTTDTHWYPDIMGHTFTLRRPGSGTSESAGVVAVAQGLAIAACDLEVQFKINPNLGFFMVVDEEGIQWGPFDSHQIAAQGWSLLLNEDF